jgi:prepilin-type N-terminal cleavage/methylation domain-containing protein
MKSLMHILQKKKNIPRGSNGGFTLVELLVSISIFVVITAILMIRYNKFDDTILLTNLAYDMALTIRQAQTYGLNTREASPGVFTKSYGVHFSGNDNKSFTLFADLDDNNQFDSASDKVLSVYTIKKNNTISDVCAGSQDDCVSISSSDSLSLIFKRPNPEAIINDGTGVMKSYAKITLESKNGEDHTYIVVRKTGQISIE